MPAERQHVHTRVLDLEKGSDGKAVLEKRSNNSFGMGYFTMSIAPRRDERLRPLRGIPAAPPESLAFGRGRRHIASVNCNHYLFLEVRAPVRGVVVAVDDLVLVLALLRKGLSRGFVVLFVVGKGLIDDYYLVHA